MVYRHTLESWFESSGPIYRYTQLGNLIASPAHFETYSTVQFQFEPVCTVIIDHRTLKITQGYNAVIASVNSRNLYKEQNNGMLYQLVGCKVNCKMPLRQKTEQVYHGVGVTINKANKWRPAQPH